MWKCCSFFALCLMLVFTSPAFAMPDNAKEAAYALDNAKKYLQKEDYKNAIKCLEESAILGNPEARFLLGVMFYEGRGIEQNFRSAREWFEKAASQGMVTAQFNLGVMALKGEGGEQDLDSGRQWLEKAALQGEKNAQFNLGLMYEKGDGVSRDPIKAKEYFNQACNNGLKAGCEKYAALNKKSQK